MVRQRALADRAARHFQRGALRPGEGDAAYFHSTPPCTLICARRLGELATPMDALDCMSPRTCPGCWHYRAGKCSLMAALRDAFDAPAPAMSHLQPLAVGGALA